MFPVTIKEIMTITHGRLLKGSPESFIYDFCTDSRVCAEGMFFICIHGLRFNGHYFISDVIRKHAMGIMVNKSENIKVHDSIPCIIEVDDTIQAMLDISRFLRSTFEGEIIGITGSVGKTTTKDFIHTVLKQEFNTHCSFASHNNEIGIPLTLFGLQKKHDIGIVELGSNGPGQIDMLSEVVRPDVGIVTRIGPAHLGTFRSLGAIVDEKASIFNYMNSTGLAVLNGDDEHFTYIRNRTKCRVLTVGYNACADIQVQQITDRDNLYQIFVKPFSQKLEIAMPVLGDHNIYAILFSVAVGFGLGMSSDKIMNGIKAITLPKNRLQFVEMASRKIINDSYNANPLSMEAALNVLCNCAIERGQHIFVCGDMLELGEWSSQYHYELGAKIDAYKVNKLILIGSWAQDVRKGAIDNGFSKEHIYCCKTNQEVVDLLSSLLEPEDVALIKGSHDMYMDEIVKGVEQYFSTLNSLIV